MVLYLEVNIFCSNFLIHAPKYSYRECIFKDLSDLYDYLVLRCQTLKTWNIANTPFVVFYGPFDDLKSFVRIHQTNYESDDGIDLTPTQAIDICFKSFIALRKKFTHKSDCPWVFSERFIYELKTDIKCKNYKNIDKLIVEFNKLR